MGNTGSSKRDRTYSSESESPASPSRDDKVFQFGSGTRKGKFLYQPSLEEYDDVPADAFQDKVRIGGDLRPRSPTTSISSYDNEHFPTVFKWEGGGREVFISGTFSNWKPIPMAQSHGDFALILDIPEGDHQYKFQVDGQWMHSPNQTTVDNDMGTKNNLISIKRADFEVFQALADDSNFSSGGSPVCGSILGSYSQEVPQRKPCEKSIGPPVLPPHLLEVILNKDISLNNEPTLLPEPNHVMLNHLYALSIKDGVLVLSASLRFRKKYVTTLLYKPI